MTYSVKEMYYTLQGEGAQTGRPAVFLRFAGCNLWSGRELHRMTSICKFCDTDFVGTDGTGGGKFATAEDLAAAVVATWSPEANDIRPLVVCTGGEPLLQLDEPLITALHMAGFGVAVETNGTIPAPPGIDWLCVSPKGSAELIQRSGDELKLVFPQIEADAQPSEFIDLPFTHFFLQPLDNEEREKNTSATVQYCLQNPRWRLSLQTHKYLGID